jgi:hypothetical protein
MRRDPLSLPTTLKELWWSDLTIKPECKQKDSQYSLAAPWVCGFTVVLTSSSPSATISPSHPQEKE